MSYDRYKIFRFSHASVVVVMLHTLFLNSIFYRFGWTRSNPIASTPVEEVIADILKRVSPPTSLGWKIIPYTIDSLPAPKSITYEPDHGGSWVVKYTDTSQGWGFSFFGGYSSEGRVEIFGAERWLCQDSVGVKKDSVR